MRDRDSIIDRIWSRIEAAPGLRGDSFRTPTLATVSPAGDAEVRTVVLRAASAQSRTLSIHTDTASAKFQALRHTPRAALCFWDPKSRIQLRLGADAYIESGDAVTQALDALSASEKKQYGVSPSPGTTIEHPGAYGYRTTYRFARILCVVKTMDVLWLSKPKHRRLRVNLDETTTQSAWVVP